MTELRAEATKKWHEYVKAFKDHKDPVYKDLAAVYNQVRSGRKIIDISKVIAKGGIHKDITPRLAVAPIQWKKVFCKYHKNGGIEFLKSDSWKGRFVPHEISLLNCLPEWKNSERWPDHKILSAPVPPIPPKFMPAGSKEGYFILWEVDEWKMIPPTDPYLLKRITKTMFVVLAGWDLTELEKSAMAGRMI